MRTVYLYIFLQLVALRWGVRLLGRRLLESRLGRAHHVLDARALGHLALVVVSNLEIVGFEGRVEGFMRVRVRLMRHLAES